MGAIAGMSVPARGAAGERQRSWAFVGCFAGGAALIVAGKLLGWPQWLVTAGPLLVIFGYFGWVALAGDPRLADEAAADSLYYLGFLFTLVSLAVALTYFRQEREPVEAIVSNFGIALATTICGVALRVVLLQWRADPADIERQARLDLLEAALALRNQLDAMVAEFKAARDRLVETASEGIGAIVDAAGAPLLSFRGRSEELLTTLGAAFADFIQNAERVRTAAARVAGGVEDLAARVDAVAVPPDLLERKLDAALAGFARALEAQAAEVEETRRGQQQLRRHLEAALRALEAVGGRAGDIAAQFDRAVTALSAVEAAAPAFAALGTSAAEAQGKLGAFGETLARHDRLLAGLTLDAESAAEHLRAGRQAVADAAGAMGREVDGLRGAHEALRRAIEAHATTVAAAHEQQAAMAARLEHAAGTLERYVAALTDADRAITALGAAAGGLAEAATGLPAATAALADVRERLQAFVEGVTAQGTAVRRCAEGVAADLDLVRAHRAALEEELGRAREAVGQVFRTQVGLARLIVEQLDGHGRA